MLNLKASTVGVAALVAVAIPAFSQSTIEGTLEIAKNMFVVVTDRPVSGGSDFDNSIVESRRVMLIGYTSEKTKTLAKLEGKRVRAKGVLTQAFTRYHTEPLVFSLHGLPKEMKK